MYVKLFRILEALEGGILLTILHVLGVLRKGSPQKRGW